MGNRKQPFGYKMALGEIIIQEAEARLVPVSYTHLDVYKRQHQQLV